MKPQTAASVGLSYYQKCADCIKVSPLHHSTNNPCHARSRAQMSPVQHPSAARLGKDQLVRSGSDRAPPAQPGTSHSYYTKVKAIDGEHLHPCLISPSASAAAHLKINTVVV